MQLTVVSWQDIQALIRMFIPLAAIRRLFITCMDILILKAYVPFRLI
ncbi:MAG: hypothetical protein JW753_05725 [Dehalococcoidia bacterium]|nr:hypothetical protein [Dehalococcoidia bacterium]